ncbi:26S proteasome regulatory subunit 8 homolog A-like isoform X7 [Zingiber officinale]|nr:26S proteasome regulatory subunit 8 homolog A-like isoform X7 [Zingiber officinale]
MASAVVEKKQPVEVEGEMCAPTTQVRGGGGKGLRQYYVQYIHDLQLQIRKKANNLQRLEAQRNDLNSRVRMLREELQLLQKPSSYVGEVVKVMGKSKVLVKASGPMYCYKDGKLTALEEANQPDGIYVHEKCVV